MQHEKSATQNCNTRVQHENWSSAKVPHKKSATQKSAIRKEGNMNSTRKKRNMELVQHEKRATWKDCNINKVQYGNNATSTKYNTKIAQTKNATSKSAT